MIIVQEGLLLALWYWIAYLLRHPWKVIRYVWISYSRTSLYIPIEKIIRTVKQSASTSWQCNTSGKPPQSSETDTRHSFNISRSPWISVDLSCILNNLEMISRISSKSKSGIGQGFAHLLGKLSCIPWYDLSNATHPGWTTKGRATGGMVTFQIDLL